ncbi:uncharacterized protein UDID_17165 [Ustilago sp. UG-2017a]|nr:uncharacterized protein UDID_17165 [Ustilago sp. UG-2017a]
MRTKSAQSRVDNEATNETEIEVPDDDADEETDSDSNLDNGSKQYNFCTLAKLLEPVPKLTAHIKSFLRSVPHPMKHLKGAYDKKHAKWNHTFDDALTNALHGTIETTGEYNVNYLILDIIREYHTFHQVWKKIENSLTNEATATSCQLTLITQLGNVRMFNSDARKLIQEIRSIQTENIATINQLNFNALATALTTHQSAIESNPAQKIDPRQASARITGSDDQDESTKMDEKDEKDDDHTSAKVAARPRKIRCWICKRSGHGARCNRVCAERIWKQASGVNDLIGPAVHITHGIDCDPRVLINLTGIDQNKLSQYVLPKRADQAIKHSHKGDSMIRKHDNRFRQTSEGCTRQGVKGQSPVGEVELCQRDQ